MKTTVHYTGTFLEKEASALADAKAYATDLYGPKGWDLLRDAANEGSPAKFRMACGMFAGIEGYAVGAMLREFRPDTNETGDYGEDCGPTLVPA